MMNTQRYEDCIDQAIFWFEKAASQKMGLSMLSLYNIYKQGQGVPVNEEKWKYWLKQAELCQDDHARQGVELAILNDCSSVNRRPA